MRMAALVVGRDGAAGAHQDERVLPRLERASAVRAALERARVGLVVGGDAAGSGLGHDDTKLVRSRAVRRAKRGKRKEE